MPRNTRTRTRYLPGPYRTPPSSVRPYGSGTISGYSSGNRSFARRMAGAALEAGVRNFVPGGNAIVGAARAASTIQRAYRAYKGRRGGGKSNVTGNVTKYGKQWQGVSTAKYRGRFRKPSRKLPKVAARVLPYQNTGFLSTKEIYGKVDDLDCVYIGHSTYDAEEIALVVAIATLRKLFKKAGFNADSPDQALPLFNYGVASGFKLTWVTVRVDGTETETSYETVTGSTLRTVAAASGFRQQIVDRMMLIDGNNRGDFDRIAVYSKDNYATGTDWRLAAELNLRQEVLDVMCHSELTLQNRTKSASGDASTDVVDNQPLKGFLYEFAGGVPTSKKMNAGAPANRLNRVRYGTGMILEQAIDLDPANLYKEPPNPKQWSNCYKSSRVNLEPGDMKKTVASVSYRGYWNNLICAKFVTRTNTTLNQYSVGKCQLFAMEERLNSGSTNLITVNYECDRKIGARLISTKNPIMLSDYKETELNNVTA